MIALADRTLAGRIATTLAAEVRAADRSSLLHAVVSSAIATRLIRTKNDGNVSGLVRWAEATCERYADADSIAAMFGSIRTHVPGVVRANGDDAGAYDELLARLDDAVTTVLERQAQLATARPSDDADEIDETIAAFVFQIEDADTLTAEHSRAVSLWCRRLAKRLSLDERACAFVARGGLLHDVGKTKTPAAILLAPRALDDGEFAIMREHASKGDALVRAHPALRPFSPLVRSHHERLDGRGYPDRLHGDDISLHVRIVTVADCFNAMIGRRPYRPPMTPATALDQLVANQGTQFDPLVVEAMVDLMERPDS